ncbi:MAG: response regulator transcription factor [Bryobacterales bacterium]|nr:response regulator transcription factor [Bryobacterales bacterium]
MKTRVMLADDHAILRAGLKLVIEREPDLQVVGEAVDGRQAVDLALDSELDVLVMDVAMPGLNGIEAARQILLKKPALGLVILSMHADESYVLRSLKAGARGYLLKESAESDVIAAIRAVAHGKSFFSPKVAELLQQEYVQRLRQEGKEDSYESLTAREREILQMIAEGQANKDVANKLNLSLYTVETHRGNILQKLGLRSAAEVVLYAVRKGIVR